MTAVFRILSLFLQTFSQTNITRVCPGSQCMFAFYGGESVYHRYILVLHLCNLFVFLWLVNFTMALGQCTLAGAFASYYWALKKPRDIPACPLCASFCRAIRYDRTAPLDGTIVPPNISQFIFQACLGKRTCSNVHYSFFYSYHTGSLAFGSLILSLVQIIRIVLEYLDRKLKGDLCNLKKQTALLSSVTYWWWMLMTGSSNAFSRFLICCLKCCFWCLEKFIRFMNRNAYIMVSSKTAVPLMFFCCDSVSLLLNISPH